MQFLFLLIPLSIGAVTVLQGGLNRQMGANMGLGMALVINSILALLISLAFYGLVRLLPDYFPPLFKGTFEMSKVGAWMILPGIFGFCIIAGIPWAISKIGAAKVFVVMIMAQMAVSMLWDIFAEGKPFSTMRLIGVLCAAVGAILVSLDKG